MNNYLFKISTKVDVWSAKKARPVYFVARDKAAANEWAINNLQDGLKVSRITKLAVQIAGSVFSSDM